MTGPEQICLAIGAVGGLFLLVSLFGGVIDLDFDADDGGDGPSWFNPIGIAVGLVGFGAVGFAALNAGLSLVPSLALAFLVFGILVAGIFFGLVKYLADRQSNSLISSNSHVGRTGRVSLAIPSVGLGEITFIDVGGAEITYPALSATGDPIPHATSVIIINVTDQGAVVDINPLED